MLQQSLVTPAQQFVIGDVIVAVVVDVDVVDVDVIVAVVVVDVVAVKPESDPFLQLHPLLC